MTNGNESVHFVPDKMKTITAMGIESYGSQGLTKREHFASMFLQGMLSNSAYASNQKVNATTLVQVAVGAADMLIDELNKGVK